MRRKPESEIVRRQCTFTGSGDCHARSMYTYVRYGHPHPRAIWSLFTAARESPEGPDRIVPCPGLMVGLNAAPGARPSGERVSGLQHSWRIGRRARPGTCAFRH